MESGYTSPLLSLVGKICLEIEGFTSIGSPWSGFDGSPTTTCSGDIIAKGTSIILLEATFVKIHSTFWLPSSSESDSWVISTRTWSDGTSRGGTVASDPHSSVEMATSLDGRASISNSGIVGFFPKNFLELAKALRKPFFRAAGITLVWSSEIAPVCSNSLFFLEEISTTPGSVLTASGSNEGTSIDLSTIPETSRGLAAVETPCELSSTLPFLLSYLDFWGKASYFVGEG